MDNPISQDVEQRILALCDEIAVAHDLDSELREELRGHVEDKMLGYLSGDEAVTEADAFILAREHFGDRKRLKAMLSDVHHIEASATLWRKIAAIAAVTLCLDSVIGLSAAGMDTALTVASGYLLETHRVFFQLTHLWGLVYVVVLWLVVRRWRRRLSDGEQPWFLRWPVWAFALTISALLAVGPVRELIAVRLWVWTSALLGPSGQPVLIGGRTLAVLVATAKILIWIWWCDSPPRQTSAPVKAALAWFVLTLARGALSGGFRFESGMPNAPHALVLQNIGDGSLFVYFPFFYLRNIWNLQGVFRKVAFPSFYAILGLLAYLTGLRLTRNNCQRGKTAQE